MARANFTLTQNQDMIKSVVSAMSKVECVLQGAVLSVETVPPYDDELDYGPRMNRVENVVKGLDPTATREDLPD